MLKSFMKPFSLLTALFVATQSSFGDANIVLQPQSTTVNLGQPVVYDVLLSTDVPVSAYELFVDFSSGNGANVTAPVFSVQQDWQSASTAGAPVDVVPVLNGSRVNIQSSLLGANSAYSSVNGLIIGQLAVDSDAAGTLTASIASANFFADGLLEPEGTDVGELVISTPVDVEISDGGEPVLLGDVNGDGNFNAADPFFLQRFLVGLIPTLPNPEAADISQDGNINSADAFFMQRVLVGLLPNPNETVGKVVTSSDIAFSLHNVLTGKVNPYQDQGQVTLQITGGPFSQGDMFEARLAAHVGDAPLGGYQVNINYDPAILSVVGFPTGGSTAEYNGPPISNTSQVGTIAMTANSNNPASFTTPTGLVDLAVITFQVNATPQDFTETGLEVLFAFSAADFTEIVLDPVPVMVPLQGQVEPPTNTPVPPTNTPESPTNTPIPPTNTPVPPTATSTNTPVPPTATNTPESPTNTPVPPTATSTNTPESPTNTPVPPTPTNTPESATNTPVPPTATSTNTPESPTNTPVPPTATNTPESPTETPVPPTPTNTPESPTNTPVPPTATNTPESPTETPVPPTPTNTPESPTNTPVQPTNTPELPTPTPTSTPTQGPPPEITVTDDAGLITLSDNGNVLERGTQTGIEIELPLEDSSQTVDLEIINGNALIISINGTVSPEESGLASSGGQDLVNGYVVDLEPVGNDGYLVLDRFGHVQAYGTATFTGDESFELTQTVSFQGQEVTGRASIAVDLEVGGGGYYILDRNGVLYNFGGAPALPPVSDAGNNFGQTVAFQLDTNGYTAMNSFGQVMSWSTTTGFTAPTDAVRTTGAPVVDFIQDGTTYFILDDLGTVYNTAGVDVSNDPVNFGNRVGRQGFYDLEFGSLSATPNNE